MPKITSKAAVPASSRVGIKRMAFIRKATNKLKAFVVKEQTKILEEATYKLAIKNQDLMQCQYPSFMFEGQWYAAIPIPRASQLEDWNRYVHPSLLKEVHAVFHNQDFEQLETQGVINNFFVEVFTEAQHWDDIVQLVPGGLLGKINSPDPDMYNIGPVMTPEVILEFKTRHEVAIKKLNRLTIRDLLLKNQ